MSLRIFTSARVSLSAVISTFQFFMAFVMKLITLSDILYIFRHYCWTLPYVTYTNWALFCTVTVSVAVGVAVSVLSQLNLSEPLPRAVIFLIAEEGFLPAIVCVCTICLQYISYYLFLCCVIIWTSPWP